MKSQYITIEGISTNTHGLLESCLNYHPERIQVHHAAKNGWIRPGELYRGENLKKLLFQNSKN